MGSAITLTLLLTSMLTLAFNIQSVKTESTTIVVPDDYPTIQEAINAAGPGDIIFVSSGTYHEQLVVDKAISLFGENRDTTIIDTDEPATVVRVNADNVTISGFTIQATGYFPAWETVVIEIFGSYNRIDNNLFRLATDVDSGIMLLMGEYNVISSNSFQQEIIKSLPSMGAILVNGLHNEFVNNTFDTDWAIGLGGSSSYNIIANNDIICREVAIFSSNRGNWIQGNKIELQGEAMRFGILLSSSHDHIVANNNITGHASYATIYINQGANNQILNNQIPGSHRSIFLLKSTSNTLSGNIITSKKEGVFLYHGSNNNSVTNNHVEGLWGSILVHESTGNKIWGNNFVDRFGTPHDGTGQNEWDQEGQGNYWSLHHAERATFLIPPAGEDRFPATQPKTIYSVPLPDIPTPGEVVPPESSVMDICGETKTINGDTVLLEQCWINVCHGGRLIIEGTNLVLESGWIWARNGGEIIIRDSELFLGSRGEVEIRAVEGSNLLIERSIIASDQEGGGFSLLVSHSSLNIRDSELHGITGATLIEGMELIAPTELIIKDSLITGSHSITVANPSNVLIKGNTFKGIFHGIWVQNAVDDVLISNNIVYDPQWRGISVSGEGRIEIRGNTVGNPQLRSTFTGITVQDNVLVENNKVLNFRQNIHVAGNNNIIRGNTLSNASEAVWVVGDNNTIYLNDILNSGAKDEGANNRWDDGYPSGGNYWSDYVGVDVKGGPDQDQPGSDGIGDTPYVIDANNQDRYPLMNPIGSPQPPIALFAYAPEYPLKDETVTFNATSSYDRDGSIVSYKWDFGDGNTTITTDSIITHIYIATGTYIITLKVTDPAGNTATDSLTVTVLPAEAFPAWIIGATIATIALATAAVTLILWKRRK